MKDKKKIIALRHVCYVTVVSVMPRKFKTSHSGYGATYEHNDMSGNIPPTLYYGYNALGSYLLCTPCTGIFFCLFSTSVYKR